VWGRLSSLPCIRQVGMIDIYKPGWKACPTQGIQIMKNSCVLFILSVIIVPILPALGSATPLGLPDDFDPQQLRDLGIYDFVTASEQGRSIGEMVLDIEGAPARAYEVLENAVATCVFATDPKDNELATLKKVDSALFGALGFSRGVPGTTFTEALMRKTLDCSDASLVFITVGERAGRRWRAAMAPFHMFVAAPEGEWFIFWETQTGAPFDVYDMIAYHGLRQELIQAGVYLNAMSVRNHVAETYRNIGGILVRKGQLSRAMAYLNKSLWLWPDHPPTLIWRGYALALAGDYAKAEADYLAALDIDPLDWVANYHLGVLYNRTGREEDGKALIKVSEQYRPPNARWVLEEALPYIREKY